ncbi:hypothetical protein SAMN04488587_1177 [Methanococcoides vulcani]|uniref:Uncharacterized protein n=1 Tax=Methanococcoides vulcani TaxID=1353158 RepID=A0A1H9ZPI9_9EURY|nr:hypothetical protein [Methanococcoides vulcani]SES83678.1 hypothetical protein SAMN04488587_1177 [Methanococcoides vulcani]
MNGRRKASVHTTVSPLAERQLESLVDSHNSFSSKSDAVDKAIGMLYYAVNHNVLVQVCLFDP